MGLAVGMLLAPVLVALLGPQGAIIAVGLFLPLVGLAVGRRLVALDARAIMPLEQIRLLEAIPIFAPLSRPRSSGWPGR